VAIEAAAAKDAPEAARVNAMALLVSLFEAAGNQASMYRVVMAQ
jgi:hypothetical protein